MAVVRIYIKKITKFHFLALYFLAISILLTFQFSDMSFASENPTNLTYNGAQTNIDWPDFNPDGNLKIDKKMLPGDAVCITVPFAYAVCSNAVTLSKEQITPVLTEIEGKGAIIWDEPIFDTVMRTVIFKGKVNELTDSYVLQLKFKDYEKAIKRSECYFLGVDNRSEKPIADLNVTKIVEIDSKSELTQDEINQKILKYNGFDNNNGAIFNNEQDRQNYLQEIQELEEIKRDIKDQLDVIDKNPAVKELMRGVSENFKPIIEDLQNQIRNIQIAKNKVLIDKKDDEVISRQIQETLDLIDRFTKMISDPKDIEKTDSKYMRNKE